MGSPLRLQRTIQALLPRHGLAEPPLRMAGQADEFVHRADAPAANAGLWKGAA